VIVTTEFEVSEVIDGDTFEVESGWEWHDKTGDAVRPTGYDAPDEGEEGFEEAKRKLADLILRKKVDIKNPQTVDDHGRIVADVYFEGKNLADYFPEYKT